MSSQATDIETRLAALEAQVREVADREAIRELTAQYCHCVVAGDGEGLVALFTDDASLETHFPGGSGQGDVAPTGAAQLRETYKDVGAMQLKPFIHNHLIEVDGDQARGVCSVEIRFAQGGEAYTGAGHYEDEYRRVGNDWKFQKRRLIVYHWVPLSKGWA